MNKKQFRSGLIAFVMLMIVPRVGSAAIPEVEHRWETIAHEKVPQATDNRLWRHRTLIIKGRQVTVIDTFYDFEGKTPAVEKRLVGTTAVAVNLPQQQARVILPLEVQENTLVYKRNSPVATLFHVSDCLTPGQSLDLRTAKCGNKFAFSYEYQLKQMSLVVEQLNPQTLLLSSPVRSDDQKEIHLHFVPLALAGAKSSSSVILASAISGRWKEGSPSYVKADGSWQTKTLTLNGSRFTLQVDYRENPTGQPTLEKATSGTFRADAGAPLTGTVDLDLEITATSFTVNAPTKLIDIFNLRKCGAKPGATIDVLNSGCGRLGNRKGKNKRRLIVAVRQDHSILISKFFMPREEEFFFDVPLSKN